MKQLQNSVRCMELNKGITDGMLAWTWNGFYVLMYCLGNQIQETHRRIMLSLIKSTALWYNSTFPPDYTN
jgi:hypothetical protein